MKKLLWIGLLLSCVPVLGQATAPTFSPAGGTYSAPQSVTITCASGDKATYTLDGSPPNIASTLYTGPLTVGGATLKAICANIQVHQQGTQTSYGNISGTGIGYECTTPNSETYGSLGCQAGGGVGTNQPSNVSMSFGPTETISVSTTASSGQTQALFPYFGPGCDNCDYFAQDKYVEANGGKGIVVAQEMDFFMYDHTRGKNLQIGLQCNLAGTAQWQRDNVGGAGWQNLGITQDCPLPETTFAHIGWDAHRIIGDTGCGGPGCIYYDHLTLDGTLYTINATAPMTSTTYRSIVGNQDQVDLTNTATSGSNPTTGGRKVQKNNIAAAIGAPSAITSATYTISSTPTVANPTASPAPGTYFAAQSVTLSDSTASAVICYTTDGSTPAASTAGTCSAGTAYSAAIAVSATTTIKALGTLSGEANSGVVTFAYTISIPSNPNSRGNIDVTQIKSSQRLSLGTLLQMTQKGAFSTLSACGASGEGDTATVTDSTVTAYGATIAGGGTNTVHAWCNGSAWVVD